MFRKHKIIVFAFIFGFIFFNMNILPVQAQAQPDNFPIGLYIVYTVSHTLSPSEEIIDTTRYDFRHWIDQESLLLEYEQDDVTQNGSFHEITLDGPDHAPIWMDVSTWELYDAIKVSEIYYGFIQIVNHWVPPFGDVDCYRLERVVSAYGRENASTIWYHGQLGILVDYNRIDWYLPNDSLIEHYTEFIYGSNLDDFNPPTFHVPEPVQTTTTTTTPTITTASSSTTSSTSHTSPLTRTTVPAISPRDELNVILGAGIIVEVLILTFIIRRRE